MYSATARKTSSRKPTAHARILRFRPPRQQTRKPRPRGNAPIGTEIAPGSAVSGPGALISAREPRRPSPPSGSTPGARLQFDMSAAGLRIEPHDNPRDRPRVLPVMAHVAIAHDVDFSAACWDRAPRVPGRIAPDLLEVSAVLVRRAHLSASSSSARLMATRGRRTASTSPAHPG